MKLSFITTGPSFSVPENLFPRPVPVEQSSPLRIATGQLREMAFLPAKRFPGPGEDFRLLESANDRAGNSVEIWEQDLRYEEDAVQMRQWYGLWSIAGGYAFTHVRPEDGGPEALVSEVLDNIELEPLDQGGVFAHLFGSLSRGASELYPERVALHGSSKGEEFDADHEDFYLELSSPSVLPVDQSRFGSIDGSGDPAGVRRGTGRRVGISVGGEFWGSSEQKEAVAVSLSREFER